MIGPNWMGTSTPRSLARSTPSYLNHRPLPLFHLRNITTARLFLHILRFSPGIHTLRCSLFILYVRGSTPSLSLYAISASPRHHNINPNLHPRLHRFCMRESLRDSPPHPSTSTTQSCQAHGGHNNSTPLAATTTTITTSNSCAYTEAW